MLQSTLPRRLKLYPKSAVQIPLQLVYVLKYLPFSKQVNVPISLNFTNSTLLNSTFCVKIKQRQKLCFYYI